MRSKRRQTNIKLLESNMRQVAIAEKKPEVQSNTYKIKDDMVAGRVVKPVEKTPKPKGAKKAALINTKKLLTM